MILDDARKQVVTMLDDPDGQRWTLPPPLSLFDVGNEVDLAIQSAAVECVSAYVHQGGDFFDVIKNITTDNDGTYSFTNEAAPNVPMMVESCSYRQGDYFYSLHAVRHQDVQVSLNEVVDLKVKVVYTPDFAGSALGGGDQMNYSQIVGGQVVPWAMFDMWVCSVAAKQLTPKENEANSQLDDKVSMLSSACLRAPDQPKTVIFPRQQHYLNWGPSLYRWSYVTRDSSVNKTCCLRIHKVRIY